MIESALSREPGAEDVQVSGELQLDRAASIRRLARRHAIESFAVAACDLTGGRDVSLHADRPFHPASTVKLAILVEAHAAVEAGRLELSTPLKIINRFRSLADGKDYTLAPEDDSDPNLYARIGTSLAVEDLLEHMIVQGSNLAANVLLERLGAEHVTATVAALGAPGLVVRRGLQDLRAYARGLNNETTARSLRTLLLRVARGEAVSPQASRAMVERLLREPSTDGLRALLPAGLAVAHRSGWTETVYHDAGIIFAPGQEPCVAVVLTECPARGEEAREFVAGVALELQRGGGAFTGSADRAPSR